MEPVKISIASNPCHIAVVRTAVETFGLRQGLPREQTEQMGLAVNEALANVIKHGYQGKLDEVIHIALDVVELDEGELRALKVVIRDFGRQVDPATIKSRDLDEVRPGGLGVHIIRTVMNEVNYRPMPDGGMELTLLKYLPAAKEVAR